MYQSACSTWTCVPPVGCRGTSVWRTGDVVDDASDAALRVARRYPPGRVVVRVRDDEWGRVTPKFLKKQWHKNYVSTLKRNIFIDKI